MDFQFVHKKHSYVIFEVLRCSDYVRKADDPECAHKYAINDWIENKKM